MRNACRWTYATNASPLGWRAALLGFAALSAGLLGAPPASALDADQAYTSASQQLAGVAKGLGSIQETIRTARANERSPERQIADAVLLVGAKDYSRAIVVLNEVVERFPQHPTAYPDAVALLGEAYFRSKQLYSARRTFKEIVDRGNEPRFQQYLGKALGRLVDVTMRLKDYDKLDAIFASMNRVPPGAVTSGLAYAKGKGLFARKDWAGARASLAAVEPASEYYHQAQYILGLIEVKDATPPPVKLADGDTPPPVPTTRYAKAIDQFLRATRLAADTSEHRQVIDLSWLAIGRLLYEADQWTLAVQAYNHVDRTSPEFGAMLYELAWVYVRLGDVERAQRALEVLAVAEPNSANIADGQLLRSDLMLRAGQFDKALKVYESVRATYDPMRAKVDAFLGSTSDPAVYYDKLSQEQLEALDNNSILPPLALQWAREAEDGPLAFAVVDDVAQCRELIKQSNDMIERLNSVLSSPNRVRAFPELKAGEERALSFANRVSLARLTLGQGIDNVSDDRASGDLMSWRMKRRSLEKRLGVVPTTDADFQERESQALSQWNAVSQGVQRLQLQVDSLQATVNGLRRMLREGPQTGVVRNPASIAQFEAELAKNERELVGYRQQMDGLRKMIVAGRVQVGFGDQRFVEDAQVRRAYREALENEVRIAAGGAGGARLQGYAQRLVPLLQQADETETRTDAALADLEKEVVNATQRTRDNVQRETNAMVGYTIQLDKLDTEARLVVGEVAMRNFGLVRDRLRNIVLRADVGITEEAWEVREEQQTRVRKLQVERSREDRVLKEELNEVLDDSGEPEEEQKQ